MHLRTDKKPPLSPATVHILLALAGRDLHGYGIIQEVARHSDGHYRLGPGTLYDNLRKLMDSGLVTDVLRSNSPDEDDRRFYVLTGAGRNALRLETDRLENVVTEARLRLRGRKTGQV